MFFELAYSGENSFDKVASYTGRRIFVKRGRIRKFRFGKRGKATSHRPIRARTLATTSSVGDEVIRPRL